MAVIIPALLNNGQISTASIGDDQVTDSKIDFGTGAGQVNTDDLPEGSTNLWYTNERVDDRVSLLLQEGNNITLTYDDVANTLTIAAVEDNLNNNSLFDLGDVVGTASAGNIPIHDGNDFDVRAVTTSDIGEGTNQYFTTTRAVDAIELESSLDFTTGSGNTFALTNDGHINIASANTQYVWLQDRVYTGASSGLYIQNTTISSWPAGSKPAIEIDREVNVVGNVSDKTTTIGDFILSDNTAYKAHGFNVAGGNEAWASATFTEHEGNTNKPLYGTYPGFTNAGITGEVWGGTVGSESALGSGKRLFGIYGQGSYDDGGTITQPSSSPARFIMSTTEAQTSSARGTKVDLQTTIQGTTTRVTTASFNGNGTTLINLFATGEVVFSNLPTSDPVNAGQLWNDGGTLKISAG